MAERKSGEPTNGGAKDFEKVAPAAWDKQLLANCLSNIRNVYKHRSRIVHAALGITADDFVTDAPRGSVIDLRTYGFGYRFDEDNKRIFGIVGKRVNLNEFDELTQKIHAARLSLVPFMELADKIKHSPKPFPLPASGSSPNSP